VGTSRGICFLGREEKDYKRGGVKPRVMKEKVEGRQKDGGLQVFVPERRD
jgi:hypothetical protein